VLVVLAAAVVLAVAVPLAVKAERLGVQHGWLTNPSVREAPDLKPRAVDEVVSGLEAPWGLAFLPDGSALMTERDTARILSVQGDSVREVARIAEARPRGEGGLLGIAISPSYATDHWVYIYYTAADDDRIGRLRLDNPSLVTPVFVGIPKDVRHNGGRIAFGPDGMLYVGTGDAGDGSRSQDRSNLAGKILRLTADGAPAPGNPFGASPVYSYGHRNVQGLAWDVHGTLFASEFGQDTYDELNRIEPGGNYGWPEAEGFSDNSRFINPVATWAVADASPSGIAIDSSGYVWMACLRGQRLYRIATDGSDAHTVLQGRYGRLRDIVNTSDGSFWMLTSNRDGRGKPAPGDDRILRVRF
jgi:glucose/arabinose dehydrogenase